VLSAVAQTLQRQESIIEELERRGEDSTYARSLLRRLNEMQAVRIADRDRLRAALGKSTPVAGPSASTVRPTAHSDSRSES